MDTPNLPPLIMGGAGFSYQLHSSPESLPVVETIQRAFAKGLRTIDTAPYYDPSEELLGAALSHPDIRTHYPRSDFRIMTKCGRIAAHHFDYSPAWIRQSVQRSLQRFDTTYLDVVFCHDVEFVTLAEATVAVGTLLELKDAGLIRHVGISGYDLDVMINVAKTVLATFSKPVEVVQNWAQLSLQNTRLATHGLQLLRAAGVQAVCNASPLACGLLRAGVVPVGQLGDWHPAPAGLREASQNASTWLEEQYAESLASVALQFALVKAAQSSTPGFSVSTITGISTLSDLDQNIAAAAKVLKKPSEPDRHGSLGLNLSLMGCTTLDETAASAADPLFKGIQQMLGDWLDYDFFTPPQSSSPSPPEREGANVTSVAVMADLAEATTDKCSHL